MKTFFILNSTLWGAMAIRTGSPWFIMPQIACLASFLLVLGSEVYETMTGAE